MFCGVSGLMEWVMAGRWREGDRSGASCTSWPGSATDVCCRSGVRVVIRYCAHTSAAGAVLPAWYKALIKHTRARNLLVVVFTNCVLHNTYAGHKERWYACTLKKRKKKVGISQIIETRGVVSLDSMCCRCGGGCFFCLTVIVCCSGVGGEWSASSPCSSLTDSPPPRPEDLDDCCPGSATLPGPGPVLPHTPTAGAPLNTPPPPAARHDLPVTCMAPNDGSGVQVGRKGGHEGDQLMGRFGPGGQVGHTPHKDRPPDTDALPVRTTRRTAPLEAGHRRRRLPVDLVRKRPGEEVNMGGERRTKLPKASSPPSAVNGVTHLNGCVNGDVNGDASDLLHRRLSGLGAGAGEKRPRPNNHHRNNGFTKDTLQNGVGHLLGKNGIKRFTEPVNGRVNGVVRPERVNGGVPLRRVSGEEHRRKVDHHTNNNTEPPSSLLPSPARLTHGDTLPQSHAHAPTVGKRATQGFPHPTQDLTLSCDVGLTPPIPSPRAAHQPPMSPTSARCSAKSSSPPPHTIPTSSKSRSSSSSSGVGSSDPSSGASTPTTPCTVRFPPPGKKEASDVCRWRDCNVTLDPATSLLEHIQVSVYCL